MATTMDDIAKSLIERIAEIAYEVALPAVTRYSRQLANALYKEVNSNLHAKLAIPHYWAVYLNDGHGPIYPGPGKVLVWFRDPGNDPRLWPGGLSPERQADAGRLTRDQFYSWLKINQAARAAKLTPPMVVAAVSGATEGKKFFDNDGGMAPLPIFISNKIPEIFSRLVTSYLGPETLKVKREITVNI